MPVYSQVEYNAPVICRSWSRSKPFLQDYDRILRAHLILSEGVILHLWDSCIHGCEFEETSTPEGFHTSVKLLITGFFRTLLAYARTELCLTSHMRHL